MYLLLENHENEHAPWISPAASTCFEGGRPPPSVERIRRRSTHRRDGLAEICSKIAGRWRRECSLSSKAECCEALLTDPATSVKPTSASPDGGPARFRMVLAPSPGGACGLRS